MGQVIHRPIAYTERMTLAEFVREVNQALRNIADQVTANYFNGYPEISATILANDTVTIWLPSEGCKLTEIAVETTAGTASVTPRINGVAMGVSGGTPIVASTTATAYTIDDDNEVTALDTVDLVVSGLSAGENVAVRISLKRLQ